jgi:hypothetical protein
VRWSWFSIVTCVNGGLWALVSALLMLFLYLCLFNDTLNISYYVASYDIVKNKLERM